MYWNLFKKMSTKNNINENIRKRKFNTIDNDNNNNDNEIRFVNNTNKEEVVNNYSQSILNPLLIDYQKEIIKNYDFFLEKIYLYFYMIYSYLYKICPSIVSV